jgi:hypothetical protein
MNKLAREPRSGDRLLLPSGRVIEVDRPNNGGFKSWVCVYMRAGQRVDPANGLGHEVSLRTDWLTRYAMPAHGYGVAQGRGAAA